MSRAVQRGEEESKADTRLTPDLSLSECVGDGLAHGLDDVSELHPAFRVVPPSESARDGSDSALRAMNTTCCIVLGEVGKWCLGCLRHSVLGCGSCATCLADGYFSMARACGCWCCMDPAQRERNRNAKCGQGLFVRRPVCNGRCAPWCPRHRVDQFIMANAVLVLVLLATSGISILVGQLSRYSAAVRWNVVDSTAALNYPNWYGSVDGSGPPRTLNVYVWDLQNAEDVLFGEGDDHTPVKPQFVELGPLKYRESWQRFDVEWQSHGDEVVYRTQKFYTYDPDPGVAVNPQTLSTNIDRALLQLRAALITQADSLSATVVMLLEILEEQVCPQADDDLVSTLCDDLPQIENLIQTSHDVSNALLKAALCQSGHDISPFVEMPLQDILWGSTESPVLVQAKEFLGHLEIACRLLANFTYSPSGDDDDDAFLRLSAGRLAKGDDAFSGSRLLQKAQSLAALQSAWITQSPPLWNNESSIRKARYTESIDRVRTGKSSLDKVGKFVFFQNMSILHGCAVGPAQPLSPVEGVYPTCAHFNPNWEEDVASAHGWNRVWHGQTVDGGTTGDVFEPGSWFFASSYEHLHLLSEPLLRVVQVTKSGKDALQGLTLTRYQVPDSVFANAYEQADNAVFDQWGPSGLANFSFTGVPEFMSRPHFLGADPVLQSMIIGMEPNAALHETYLDVDANSGLTVRRDERWQQVYFLDEWHLPQISSTTKKSLELLETFLYEKFCPDKSPELCQYLADNPIEELTECLAEPSTWATLGDDDTAGGLFLPYVWWEESSQMTEDQTAALHSDLYDPVSKAQIVATWCVSIALALVAILLSTLGYRIVEAWRTRSHGWPMLHCSSESLPAKAMVRIGGRGNFLKTRGDDEVPMNDEEALLAQHDDLETLTDNKPPPHE